MKNELIAEQDAQTHHTTGHVECADGVRLFYRAWLPAIPSDKAVILLHRGHEHSGRWAETVQRLGLENTAVFAWDARGHGQSPGRRGHAEHFGVFVKDLDDFVKAISSEHTIPVENMIVVAHSVGAVIAATWVHDYAPQIRAMVLATPAFDIKLYVPLAIPGLRLLHKLKPDANIKSYVGGRLLTHDKAQGQAYDRDTVVSKGIPVNILLDLHDTARRVVEDAGAIQTPTLVLTAGSDLVVNRQPQQEFFERLSSPTKEIVDFPGFFHAIFHEEQSYRVVSTIRSFIRRMQQEQPATSSLLKAHLTGHTKSEYDKLKQPLANFCPRNLGFKIQRFAMNTVGRASEGIELGWIAGFDSGRSLDYVYENEPSGFGPLGRLIDRAYLNSVGWQGIRQRKVNLEAALHRVFAQLSKDGTPIRVVDIAAGPGRYLLDTIAHVPQFDVSATLRDRNEAGLEVGRALAAGMGLKQVRYETGDAFDADPLARITPRPTVAIVSGLYELFSDNEMVLRSLRGLSAAVPPGGYLVYTNQPWHPQVEMIARVLTNRDGEPWIMRRRTQAEMDQLVTAAGFEKIDMAIDRFGIFTVSVARRKTDGASGKG